MFFLREVGVLEGSCEKKNEGGERGAGKRDLVMWANEGEKVSEVDAEIEGMFR